jgi:hypothetical protein
MPRNRTASLTKTARGYGARVSIDGRRRVIDFGTTNAAQAKRKLATLTRWLGKKEMATS